MPDTSGNCRIFKNILICIQWAVGIHRMGVHCLIIVNTPASLVGIRLSPDNNSGIYKGEKFRNITSNEETGICRVGDFLLES